MKDKNKLVQLLKEEIDNSSASSYSKHRVEKNIDEIADLVLFKKFGPPKSIEVHPTNKCVNNCRFCIGQNIRFENSVNLSYDIMKKIIDDISESDFKISLIFSGNYGEPFVNKDFKRIRPQLFWEESGNIRKYIETYLGLFGQKL